jgi:uncharacterized protein YjbI with pentapeptide repeats
MVSPQTPPVEPFAPWRGVFREGFPRLHVQQRHIKDCRMLEANFTETNLTEADFSGSNLDRCRFHQTNLSRANLATATNVRL